MNVLKEVTTELTTTCENIPHILQVQYQMLTYVYYNMQMQYQMLNYVSYEMYNVRLYHVYGSFHKDDLFEIDNLANLCVKSFCNML